ncbi:MAG TPA: Gfo/Idh/MocA family oxidoreductase [Tepidisphaeraceae bacterium]|nr:Gfo/Idh/MocA family oxidoreductase [Tepidisphaeraceae bacterium]
MTPHRPDRRTVVKGALAITGAALVNPRALAADAAAPAKEPAAKRIKVGVIGCGSVARSYFPHLAACPFVELVSTCDRKGERARRLSRWWKVPNRFESIEQLLAGPAFDLLVNLTDMQEHEAINRAAVAAGKHVWSEKPIASTLAAGQEILADAKKRGLRVWGAPTVVNSPQFRFMKKTLDAGTLGRVAAAQACYGHTGPDWSAFFYEAGGGSMPDLAVYSLSTLTGLLGPAKSVVAMTSVVTPERTVADKGRVKVAAEDNAMILLEHAGGVISHVQSGFNYFTPAEHDETRQDHHTLAVYGHAGAMRLAGYDWAPHGVDLSTETEPATKRHAGEKHDYVWQQGASLAAECLATGKEPPFTPEHALHVVEILTAARESQATGRRVALTSTFALVK